MLRKSISHIRLLALMAALAVVWTATGATDTMTGALNERVRSLQVHLDGDPFAPPVITLGSQERLVFSFDHLAEDREYLRYELVHCNADWRPSGLVDSEFLDGFNVGDIDDYEFSQLTVTHYVHYTLTIPNAQVAPLISGNYLLKVYPESDPDDVWLQCRFMVSEQSAVVAGGVSTITDVDHNDSHQQLWLTVDTERAEVADPFNDLTVMIQQNGRYDNERALRQPLRMGGRNLSVYEHMPALIFEAGNEYRRFETSSATYPGMGVEQIEYHDPYYHMTLATDEPRAGRMYLYDQTQHGRYTVREYNSDQSDIEADYVVVHFSLDMPRQEGAMIFLDGDFTDRRFDDRSLMVYNPSAGRYERSLLLKQGHYNYQYLTVPPGASRGYTAPVEGDCFQTVNEYLVKVYARHPGDRYDRLISVSLIRG